MRRPCTYAGIFLVAMATLMLEVLLTRIVSVQAWYHLAFFVISLGMLGMTGGALVVFILPDRFRDEEVGDRLAQASIAFAVSLPLSLATLMSRPLPLVTDLGSFFGLVAAAGVISVPFVFSGLALTVALTRAGLPPGIAYGVDLCGAAVGCVLVIPLLDRVDAPSAVVVAGGLGALGGVAFAAGARSRRLALGASVVTALCLLLAGINVMSSPPPLRPRYVKGAPEEAGRVSFVRWNTYSRVTVEPSTWEAPFFWGRAPSTPPEVAGRISEQRRILIDGLADTRMERAATSPSDTEHLAWDVTEFAHHIRPGGPAAVIGLGGGRDVVAAVRAGHEPVVGIELNDAIVALHTDVMASFSGLARLAPVRLVNDEARSSLARDQARYAVLAMPMIDTWAATGAGAFSLSENGLYTVEAWRLFLSRLRPGGIFTVSRWYQEGSPAEIVRLAALAFETLFERGVREPRRHVAIVRAGAVATMLLSPSPFDDADLQAIDRHAQRLGLRPVLLPRRPPDEPLMAELAAQTSSESLRRWADAQPLDLSAPTDERPFFFNLARPGRWLREPGARHDNLTYEGNLQATRTLVYATLASALLALLTLVGPLFARASSLRGLPGADVAAALGYFALIGLGFMLVELGFLSRLAVYLGHPTLALAVLLAGIIFFAGLGSIASSRLSVDRLRLAALYPLVPAALVAAAPPMMRLLMRVTEGATTPARIGVSLLVIAPPALGLGVGFPLGLRLVQRTAWGASLGPWLWGVNGACSVCASGLGLACSMVWGVSTTLLLGAACYALLTLPVLRLRRAFVAPSEGNDSRRHHLR